MTNESLKNSTGGNSILSKGSIIKINKHSINKANKSKNKSQNKSKNNIDIYGRHRIINSCVDYIIPNPNYNQTHYNFSYQSQEIKPKKKLQKTIKYKKKIYQKKK